MDALVPECGHVSLVEELALPFEDPLVDDALDFAADGDAVAANACVTPTPPTIRPDANTVAMAPLRSLWIILITSFPRR